MIWPAASVDLWPIEDLKPRVKNPRTHSDQQIEQIAASMREWGWTNPVLVEEDGTIIAGHGRWLGAKRNAYEQVPVMVARGWTIEQVRAYVIADNKLALNAGWDEDLLKIELQDLADANFAIELVGFSGDELLEIMAEPPPPPIDDEVPAIEADPIAVPGEIWMLGNHRLMCGDATDVHHVKTLMAGKLADVLITDPPYGVSYTGKTAKAMKIKNDDISGSELRTFLRQAFSAADDVMKEGAAFYIWHADLESYTFRGACMDAGWKVRQCLIWMKNAMVLGRQDYQWIHEPCLYGWKGGAAHLWASDRKQVTVLEYDRPSSSKQHPTMKPVAMIEYQLLNNTKGQDIVLDLFGGSGTTLIAAERNGRQACMMELDPRYCDVIIRRWQTTFGRDATLESNGRTFAEIENERKKTQANVSSGT